MECFVFIHIEQDVMRTYNVFVLHQNIVKMGDNCLPEDISWYIMNLWLQRTKDRLSRFTWMFTTSVMSRDKLIHITTFEEGLFVIQSVSYPELAVYIRNVCGKLVCVQKNGTLLKPYQHEYPRFEERNGIVMVYVWIFDIFYKFEWPSVCYRNWLMAKK
jgi:hypothetical protein